MIKVSLKKTFAQIAGMVICAASGAILGALGATPAMWCCVITAQIGTALFIVGQSDESDE